MPVNRLIRARRSLPAGYQFGDARPVEDWLGAIPGVPSWTAWRRPSDVAAEQLRRRAHEHVFTHHFDVARLLDFCQCGASRDRLLGLIHEPTHRAPEQP